MRAPNTVTLIQPQKSWHDRHPSEAFDSRRAAVQRKAEFRAAQRQTRIAVTKAMGVSRQRPNVYHTLFGSYLPRTYPYNGGYLWRTSVALPPAGSARYR